MDESLTLGINVVAISKIVMHASLFSGGVGAERESGAASLYTQYIVLDTLYIDK